ncbi:hypothetical protein ACT7DG_25090 [Bacillus cereus]
MKSDKEFLGEKKGGIQKIIKTELLDSPLFLFILLFVVVGLPVNDQLVGAN